MSTTIQCGDGSNKIQWLAHAALIWYLDYGVGNIKKFKVEEPPAKVSKNTG